MGKEGVGGTITPPPCLSSLQEQKQKVRGAGGGGVYPLLHGGGQCLLVFTPLPSLEGRGRGTMSPNVYHTSQGIVLQKLWMDVKTL